MPGIGWELIQVGEGRLENWKVDSIDGTLTVSGGWFSKSLMQTQFCETIKNSELAVTKRNSR